MFNKPKYSQAELQAATQRIDTLNRLAERSLTNYRQIQIKGDDGQLSRDERYKVLYDTYMDQERIALLTLKAMQREGIK